MEPIVPLEAIQRRAQEAAAAGHCPHSACPWPPESAAAQAFHEELHSAVQQRGKRQQLPISADTGADARAPFASLQSGLELAGGTEGFPGSEQQHGLPAVVEARLAKVMHRNGTAIARALIPLITVGDERRALLGEIVGSVEITLDRFRLELVELCNQCVDFRMRSVELLNDLQVGSLHVEKPLFEG